MCWLNGLHDIMSPIMRIIDLLTDGRHGGITGHACLKPRFERTFLPYIWHIYRYFIRQEIVVNCLHNAVTCACNSFLN